MRRLILITLASLIPLSGCKFKGDPDVPAPPVSIKSVGAFKFSWNDEKATHEVSRDVRRIGDAMSVDIPIVFSQVPVELRIAGPFPKTDSCRASIWISGTKLVRAECVQSPTEVIIRRVSLFIPSFKNAVNTVEIISGDLTVTFKIRTLPNVVSLNQTPIAAQIRTLKSATDQHRLRTFEMPAIENLNLQFPTTIKGELVRRFDVRAANIGPCSIEPTSARSEEVLPIELKIVEDKAGVERDWPEWFAAESQKVTTSKAQPTLLAVYATHPYLDSFYRKFVPERAQEKVVESRCKMAEGPRETIGRLLPIGRDEILPLLRFTLSGVEASDVAASSVDTVPVTTTLEPQTFEVELSESGR